MDRPYHAIHKNDTQALTRFLTKQGQALLPMVALIEQSQLAVDEPIDVLGRASIEAVLRLSAQGVAGPPHPGKKGGAVGWHGSENGTVALAERKARVQRPRLRKKQSYVGKIFGPEYTVFPFVYSVSEHKITHRAPLNPAAIVTAFLPSERRFGLG